MMSQTLPADPFSQASEQVLLNLPIICTFAFNTFRWATAVDGRGNSFVFFSYEVVVYIGPNTFYLVRLENFRLVTISTSS